MNMFFLVYIIFLTISFIFVNRYLLKTNYLISETGDGHQKFASKIKTPLTGGIYIFLTILYFLDNSNIVLILFSFAILTLGIFSDLKLIVSAKKRLIFQLSIVLFFVIINDVQITDTRIYLLDQILSNVYINYAFVCFCILIVVNGSNFFDGLNTLNTGYFFLICLIVTFLQVNYLISSEEIIFKNFILVLAIVFIFNFLNKIFLGDSGSYLLGFFFSVLLIILYENNGNISPFFIILLLWYPSFETLFSMIRKNILNRSPMKPDSNHLHQLIYFFIKKKYSLRVLSANLLTANIINIYNLLVFLIASKFLMNTQIQVILILLNLIVYTVIYLKLFVYRYKKI